MVNLLLKTTNWRTYDELSVHETQYSRRLELLFGPPAALAYDRLGP
jgi:hypothetical protein